MLPGIGEELEASVRTRVTWMPLFPGQWVGQEWFVCLRLGGRVAEGGAVRRRTLLEWLP